MMVGSLPTTEKRPPLGSRATLPLSYFTRALESWNNEARRLDLQVKLQVIAWIGGRSAFHVFNLAIMDVQCIMPILEPVEPTNDIIVAIELYYS